MYRIISLSRSMLSYCTAEPVLCDNHKKSVYFYWRQEETNARINDNQRVPVVRVFAEI